MYSDDLTQTASQIYFTTLNSCCYWGTSDPEDGLHLHVWETVSIDKDALRHVNNILTKAAEGNNPTTLLQQGSMLHHFYICLYIHSGWTLN